MNPLPNPEQSTREMKYILSLCIKYPDDTIEFWSIVSLRYTYNSLRRALQAKKEWQKHWDRYSVVSNGVKKAIKVRIEHFYHETNPQ